MPAKELLKEAGASDKATTPSCRELGSTCVHTDISHYSSLQAKEPLQEACASDEASVLGRI